MADQGHDLWSGGDAGALAIFVMVALIVALLLSFTLGAYVERYLLQRPAAQEHLESTEALCARGPTACNLALGLAGQDALFVHFASQLPRLHDLDTRERVLYAIYSESADSHPLVAMLALRALINETPDAKGKRIHQLALVDLLGRLGRKAEAAALGRALIAASEPGAEAQEARAAFAVATMGRDEIVSAARNVPAGDIERAQVLAAGAEEIGDYTDAATLYERVVASGRAGAYELDDLLWLYRMTHRFEDGMRYARAHVGDAAIQSDSFQRFAEAAAAASPANVDPAVALLDARIAVEGDRRSRRDLRQARFRILDQAGRLPAAVAALEKAGDTRTLAMVALDIQHDYARAVTLYGQLVQADPDSSDPAEGLAAAQRHLQSVAAIARDQPIVARDPSNRAATVELLGAWRDLEDWDAIGKFDEAWVGDGRDPAKMWSLGNLYRDAGAGDLADMYLRDALAETSEKEDQWPAVALDLATLWQGSQPEFASWLRRAVAFQQHDPEARERALARLAMDAEEDLVMFSTSPEGPSM